MSACSGIFGGFRPGDDQDSTVAERDRGRFGWPFGLRQPRFDHVLRPCFSVVGAGQGSPGIEFVILIVSREPESHESDFRKGKDIRDLHGHRIQFRRCDPLEGDSVDRAIEVMMPYRSAAADPEKHGPLGIKTFSDGDFAISRLIGDQRFRGPGETTIRGGSGIDPAAFLSDVVPAASTVRADQFFPTA